MLQMTDKVQKSCNMWGRELGLLVLLILGRELGHGFWDTNTDSRTQT